MTEFLRELDRQFPEECQTSSMEEFNEWFSSCCQQRPESAHVKALKAMKPVRATKAQKEGYEGEQKSSMTVEIALVPAIAESIGLATNDVQAVVGGLINLAAAELQKTRSSISRAS